MKKLITLLLCSLSLVGCANYRTLNENSYYYSVVEENKFEIVVSKIIFRDGFVSEYLVSEYKVGERTCNFVRTSAYEIKDYEIYFTHNETPNGKIISNTQIEYACLRYGTRKKLTYNLSKS